MGLKLIKTGDDSPTFYNQELDEHYHSTHGAYKESVHVYIDSGLNTLTDLPVIRVFEMGFGTGLNILLTKLFSQEKDIPVEVTTVELFPLEKADWKELTYAKTLDEVAFFEQMHSCEWEKKVGFDSRFSLTKHKTALVDFENESSYDIIFYDAFGPRVQPELWGLSIFEKLYSMLDSNGVLVTYCAKGQVRRDMQTAGFEVERLPGPPGKREMLRATKR